MGEEPVTEVVDITPAVVVHESSLVRPAADLSDIEAAFHAYTAMCERLLVDADYQRIGSKDFRKKSAWRKLAVAFGVSCKLVDRAYERDPRGRIVRAEVVTLATAPNGRYMEGLGACDVTERCCEKADDDDATCSNRSSYHKHCATGCPGFLHFSKPGHDIPATAMTRATNRACADLFGMGEVSAEEVSERDIPAPAPSGPPPAKTEGWVDAEQEAGAHRTLAATIAKLPTDHEARVLARRLKDEGAWPMSKERFCVLQEMLVSAPETPDPAPPPPAPVPQAPEASHGPQSTASGAGDARTVGDVMGERPDTPEREDGSNANEEPCCWCARVIPPGGGARDDRGNWNHRSPCLDEMAEEMQGQQAAFGAKS